MKKIFILAIAAITITACNGNYADEQMESAKLMNKGGKTEKTEVKPSKNEKRGISLCRYDDIVRRPLGDTYEQYNSDGPSKPVKK